MLQPQTHHINLRLPEDSMLKYISIDAMVEFDEKTYAVKEKHISDTWILHIGQVFSEIISLTNTLQESHRRICISNLNMVCFRKGVMQWSSNEIVVAFQFELKQNGSSIKKGYIEGSGRGKGSEFGLLVYSPIFGVKNYDKAIEVALSRSISAGLEKLAIEIRNL